MAHAVSLLSTQHFGMKYKVKHILLPGGQPPAAVLAVLAHLRGPKAKRRRWALPHLPKMVRVSELGLTLSAKLRDLTSSEHLGVN